MGRFVTAASGHKQNSDRSMQKSATSGSGRSTAGAHTTAQLPKQQQELNIYHYSSHWVRQILRFTEDTMQTVVGLLVARVLFR